MCLLVLSSSESQFVFEGMTVVQSDANYDSQYQDFNTSNKPVKPIKNYYLKKICAHNSL